MRGRDSSPSTGRGGGARGTKHISVTVNGEAREAEGEPRLLLVHLLRDTFGLTGTRIGCDTSNCGACTVEREHARHLAEHAGVAYASCSVGCRTRFMKHPTPYLPAGV